MIDLEKMLPNNISKTHFKSEAGSGSVFHKILRIWLVSLPEISLLLRGFEKYS